MKVGKAVSTLDFVDAEFDFAKGVLFGFVLEVREGDLHDAAFERVAGVFETSRSIYEGFADTVQ